MLGTDNFDSGVENDNYVINSISGLEESAGELAKYRQSLGSDAVGLDEAIRILQNNWQNESGADIESILLALKGATESIQGELLPAVGNYVDIINEIVLETRRNQNTTMQ